MKKRIALVIGHKKHSPGCINRTFGVTEFDFNDKLAIAIESQASQLEIYRVYRRTYQSLPDDLNQLAPDLAIALHCNKFDSSASGSQVSYHHASFQGKAIAGILNHNLARALPLTNRGIQAATTEDKGGFLLKYCLSPIVLAEPFFLDNDQDLDCVQKHYFQLVDAYCAAIKQMVDYLENPQQPGDQPTATIHRL